MNVSQPNIEDPKEPHLTQKHARWVLLTSVFLVAACGLAYEIIAGAVSTYLLGDGVVQFSLTIGIFLSTMGLGSFLSKYITKNLIEQFLVLELIIGLLGATLTPLLLWVYASGGPYSLMLLGWLGAIGVFAGMEIPILLRILKQSTTLRQSASSVLGLDYAGALLGSLLVPVLMIPYVGTIASGCIFGLLNIFVSGLGIYTFKHCFRPYRTVLGIVLGLISGILVLGIFLGEFMGRKIEGQLYQDPIVYAHHTPFQKIVMTRWKGDLRMFLNGALQFSSKDEYRYHESLVHPAMAAVPSAKRILVIGGGDGLAVRELLKYPVTRIDLVDLDPGVTTLAQQHPALVTANLNALNHELVNVHHSDALEFLKRTQDSWDVILMDLPDPATPTLSRLYAVSTFRLILQHLSENGAMVTQATSPFFSREAYWCIYQTLSQHPTLLTTLPYRAVVPSFGIWGFVLASKQRILPQDLRIQVPTRYLTTELLPTLFQFPKDESPPKNSDQCINLLNHPVLSRAYDKGWQKFSQ